MKFAAVRRTVAEHTFKKLDVGGNNQWRRPIFRRKPRSPQTIFLGVAASIFLLFAWRNGAVMFKHIVFAEYRFKQFLTIYSGRLLNNARVWNHHDNSAEASRVLLVKLRIIMNDVLQSEGKR